MKLVIKNLKKHWLYYIVGVLFCGIIFHLSYTYPLIYDDVDYAITYQTIGWQYFNFNTQKYLILEKYYQHGRIGHGFIYFFIHFKELFSILSVLFVSLLFILIPAFIPYNNELDKKYNVLKNGVVSFGIMSLFALFFPWQFYIISDFFMKTMFLAYILPMTMAWLFAIATWFSIMNKQTQIVKNRYLLYFIILFSFLIGLGSSIFSELLSIYMIGMIIGVYILAFIRYKKINKIPIFLISLYSGIVSGTMIVLTSPGVGSALFNPDAFRKPTTFANVLLMLNNELSFISLICVGIICILAIILYLLFRKNNIKLANKSELIWKSVYLFSVYLGFVFILFITRIPYFRALVVAATVLPLVYLIILLALNICEFLPKSINHIALVFFSIVITYLILVTVHNSYLVKNIIHDFTTRINVFQESQDTDDDKLIIPVYTAPFKNIINRNYQGTGDMGHKFPGTVKEIQLLGGRIFYTLFHPQALKAYTWKPYFNKIGRDNVDFDDESITNHMTSPIKFLN